MTSLCEPHEALRPDNQSGPFLPVSTDEVEIFNHILSDELDSRFASSICCCDYCYDRFKLRWPDVPFRRMEFQRNSMESRWAVEASRLPDIYSAAELSTLKHLVRCPECLAYGAQNIWLYEHRFSNVDAIEQDIDEILQIAHETPFLLLTHPFAVSVLEEIRRQATLVTPTTIRTPLYRARFSAAVASLKQNPDALATFGAAPARVVGEGRFNHAGVPMIYISDSAETAAAEMGEPGNLCHIAELQLLKAIKILDLFAIDDDNPGFDILGAAAASALLAAPRTGEGWVKRQYVFSRFVADCAHSAGFDAICYGSIKSRDAANYVLLRPPLDFADIAILRRRQDLVCPEPASRF